MQITPVPTPRSSPAPSPAPTEQEERSNLREEPTLEIDEQKISFTNKYTPTNGEHFINNDLPSVEVFDKSSPILNGFVSQAKEGKRNHTEKETLEMKQATNS